MSAIVQFCMQQFLYLIHDFLLWVGGFNNGGFYEISFFIITVSSSDDLQMWRSFGVFQPSLDSGEGLEKDIKSDYYLSKK